MSPATTARVLEYLTKSGLVHKHGRHHFLHLKRLEEPAYAEYFEDAARRIARANKKLAELGILHR